MDGNIIFTRLPTKLIYILDSDLLKMLAILIQQEDYWTNAKKINSNGSFYKPMSEFAEVFRKKNLQDVRLMLQTLESVGFIEIMSGKNKKQANYYRICWNKIEEYNNIPITELNQSPMIRSAKRGKKSASDGTELYQVSSIIDSTELYYQPIDDSTNSYQQDSDLIGQDCTTTINNIININNNNTIDNSEFTESPLYHEYTERIVELIRDYEESDFINAIDKYNMIENTLEYATKHIPTSELEVYKIQLQDAKLTHERNGWDIALDFFERQTTYNVKSPSNSYEYKSTLNNIIYHIKEYVNSVDWECLAEDAEAWINYQWERGIISLDLREKSINKLYSQLEC